MAAWQTIQPAIAQVKVEVTKEWTSVECGHMNRKTEPCDELCLTLPGDAAEVHLDTLIATYLQEERVTKDCHLDDSHKTAIQTQTLSTIPSRLILRFKRTVAHGLGRVIKIATKVALLQELSLWKYLHPQVQELVEDQNYVKMELVGLIRHLVLITVCRILICFVDIVERILISISSWILHGLHQGECLALLR